MERPSLDSLNQFASNYSPANLFDKIAKVAKKAGVKTVYAALLLYYALSDDEVPTTAKVTVIGALGYFILPIDAIPDILGPLGYTDDLSAMILALKLIWDNITPRTHQNARKRLESWFGPVSDSELKLF